MKGKRRAAEPEERGNPFAKVLKWAGAITGLLSLAFALQQFTQMVSDTRERKRNADELYQVGKLQQSSADYSAAWATFAEGLQGAEPGGQLAKITGRLSRERQQFREAQEDLAMEWLRNLRVNVSGGERFTDAVAPLAPVLTRGIASSSGARKADLLAHFGWANFLRWREGQRELDPEPQYRQALAEDQLNPYAHAYLAHWLLWNRRAAALPEARDHFAAALRSQRARSEVRAKQVSALLNLRDAGEPDLLRAATEMRHNGEPIDESTERELRSDYHDLCNTIWRGYDYEGRGNALRGALNSADHIKNVEILFTGGDDSESSALTRAACRATLLEAFDRKPEALRQWQEVRPAVQTGATWRGYGIAAIKRLATEAQ
jgi:hypothetical protein